ncbi:MAG: hypothetical protein RR382_02420 [Tannerellaceae bacterium]
MSDVRPPSINATFVKLRGRELKLTMSSLRNVFKWKTCSAVSDNKVVVLTYCAPSGSKMYINQLTVPIKAFGRHATLSESILEELDKAEAVNKRKEECDRCYKSIYAS